MPRIALCDDKDDQRNAIESMLREYAEGHPGVTVFVFSSGQQLLCSEVGTDCEVYILDVVMPDMTGIQLGSRLRELGCRGAIIYLTVTSEFAVNAYEVRAFHYLLKPIREERLFEVLDEALAEAEKQKSACIMVKTREGLRLIQLGEIVYVELVDHTARYHLSDQSTVDSVTLRRAFRSEMEPLLSHAQFVLCGASFTVNLHYVIGVKKTALCLDGDEQIPLPRGLSVQIQQKWSDYWLGPRKGLLT